MTSNDIKEMMVVGVTNDGEYILTKITDRMLINILTARCVFHEVDKELFENMSIVELEIPNEN